MFPDAKVDPIIQIANLVTVNGESKPVTKNLFALNGCSAIPGADVLEYYARFVASGGLDGKTTVLRPGAAVHTYKAPVGVCAGIGAWNYPIQIALWKSAACLAAG